MRIFENTLVKIEAFDQEPFTWESNFLIITRKSSTAQTIRLNSSLYNFLQYQIKVDMSDYIRAFGTGEIQVYVNEVFAFEIDFDAARAGTTPFYDELMPPSVIPLPSNYHFATNQFFVSYYLPQYSGRWFQQRLNGVWINIRQITNEPFTLLVNPNSDLLRILIQDTIVIGSVFDSTFDHTFGIGTTGTADNSIYFRLEPPACDQDYFLIEWSSELGTSKSWFFKKMATVRSYDNKIDLWSIENPDGFNVLKNKIISFTVGIENADLNTRKYIADLILEDYVVMTWKGKRYRVFIDNSTFTANEQNTRTEDVKFNVKFRKFETI